MFSAPNRCVALTLLTCALLLMQCGNVFAATGSGSDYGSIKDSVLKLYNEQHVAAPATADSAPTVTVPAPTTSDADSRSVAQVREQSDIKTNTRKLFYEGLVRVPAVPNTVPSVVPVVPPPSVPVSDNVVMDVPAMPAVPVVPPTPTVVNEPAPTLISQSVPETKPEVKPATAAVPVKPALDYSARAVATTVTTDAKKAETKKVALVTDALAVEDMNFIKGLIGDNGVVALGVTGVAAAPDIQSPMHIDEAVAFALKNNFEALASDEKTRGTYWDKMGAYAQYVPAVELNYAYGSERSLPSSYNDSNGDRVLDSTHHRRDRNISIRQPLIDLGIIADVISGGAKEDIAKSDNRDVREGVAADTVNVFYKLVQARIAVQLAEQYKRYLDDLGTRMGARVEGGGGTNADLDRIRSRATLAESAHVEAVGDYETNLAEFKRLTKITPAQLRLPGMLAPAIPSDVQTALNAAVKGNPTYLSAISKIDAAAADRNKAFSGLLPKVSAQYTKTFSYDAGGAAKGNPIDGVYPNQTTESVMVVASWALNGGTAITGGMAGAAKEREMRLRSQDVLARMEQGIRAGYTAVNAAREREGILRKAVEANERVVKGFEDQYKDGNRSLFDLLDAYEQLYSSRLNLMRIIVAKTQALYQIRKQMGELIPTIMESGQE